MKITLTRGLPGSGKSTWARAQIIAAQGQTKRVNMDDLRSMLDAGEWSKSNEKFVQALQEKIVREALTEKKNVIVDNVNLHPKHEERYRQVAKDCGATFAVEDFTDVPVEECIRRDLLRTASVGEKVIRKFYRDFLRPQAVSIEAPPFLPGKPTVLLVDIDGTVAKMNGRGPHDYDKVDTDLPNQPVINIVRHWARTHCYTTLDRVIFVSGRPDLCREKTVEWLKTHVLCGLGLLEMEWNLFMRPTWMVDPKSGTETRDFRKDYVIKREIYEREILGRYNVDHCLDDRDQTVRGWRDLGLTCLQVADGNF